MKKIWNQLGHSLFAEDESSRKTKHILKTVFFFYILVLLKVMKEFGVGNFVFSSSATVCCSR